MRSPFEKFVYLDFTFDVPDDENLYQQALMGRFPKEHAAIGATSKTSGAWHTRLYRLYIAADANEVNAEL
jgi:hypothetical protein